MDAKLTLTIEESVISKAKQYAREKNRSLSDLIESYLKAITNEPEEDSLMNTPIINSLKGSFYEPEGFDYKKDLSEELAKKYM